MSAHTSGPWRVADDGIVMAREIDGRVQAWGAVAKVIGTMEPGTKEANARLVAAAPDLLAAALIALTEVMHTEAVEDSEGRVGSATEAANALRAAIAKATTP